ncbi:MAG: hypothetical protein JWM48_597, partial [Mycobacterium sp.]|nr:hypothetical protein [Mycobacterium sp.]
AALATLGHAGVAVGSSPSPVLSGTAMVAAHAAAALALTLALRHGEATCCAAALSFKPSLHLETKDRFASIAVSASRSATPSTTTTAQDAP